MSQSPTTETREPRFKPVIPRQQASRAQTSQFAAARLTIQFGGAPGTGGPIEATHEGERAQVPVIAAVFMSEESESHLTAEQFRSRPDRRASLAYRVFSAPRNFGPYALSLEHWHANESHRSHIKTSRFSNMETFETHRVSVSGLLPGVNEFRLLVHLEDAAGTRSVSDASTHLVVVEEVAALGLSTDVMVDFSAQDVGHDRHAYRGDALWQASFTLTPALDMASMRVRVSRRGSRRFEDGRLPPGVQRDIGAERAIGSWQEVAVLPLLGGTAPGILVESLGDRRFSMRLTHVLRASSTLAPMTDSWEYRFSLHHPNISVPVEVITAYVGAEIGGVSGDWFGLSDDPDAITRVAPKRIGLGE
jgi:hypothetical protein